MTYETPAELAGLIVTTMARVDQVMDEVELLRISGTVATVSALPSGAAAGDSYVVAADGHLYAWLTTAWVVARFPAVSKVTIRSPGIDQQCILRNTEMLSTPELVRVSLISTSPRSSTIPTQYVIKSSSPAKLCAY